MFFTKVVPLLIGVFLISGFWQEAHAGFFSFFNVIFKKKEKENLALETNSQNIALLNSLDRFNGDYFSGKGGGEIEIEENALVASSNAAGESKEGEEKGQISVYVVREGDTLSEIAKIFNVSVNTIYWANDLTSKDKIRPGQTLIILPISGIQYEVKKGDTIEKIAKRFKAEAGDIASFNGLSADGGLAIGETIIIPDGEFAETSQQSPGVSRPSSGYADYGSYYSRPISGGRKTQGIHGFNGIDLADYCGAPVYASASGDVVVSRSSGWNGGYGKYVAISHPNKTQTLYAHLNSILVSSGWHVAKGQIIGYVGSTGKSTGCHVHFEVRGAKNPF